jgi:DNA-binding NarL/FixJ family response regulator
MLRMAWEESLTMEQIGENLRLTASGVQTRLSRLYSKLGVHSLIEAAREATARGLLEPVEVRPDVEKVDLSDDELLSLALAQQGRSGQEIAQALDIAEKTLRNRLTRTYRKLGVRNQTAAVRRAIEMELIESEFVVATSTSIRSRDLEGRWAIGRLKEKVDEQKVV